MPTTAGSASLTVTVDDYGTVMVEPVLGCARYPDGSLLLIAHRTMPSVPGLAGPVAYRTGPHLTGWSMVWRLPVKLQTYITTHPVGATGKVSNRRVEIVDYATVVPDGHITVARGVNNDTWVGY